MEIALAIVVSILFGMLAAIFVIPLSIYLMWNTELFLRLDEEEQKIYFEDVSRNSSNIAKVVFIGVTILVMLHT